MGIRDRLSSSIRTPMRAVRWIRNRRNRWLYRDDVVKLGQHKLVIKNYYWPIGSKRIRYGRVVGFERRPLAAWNGQFRVHGIDHKGRWYSRDRHRGEKEAAIDLDLGRRIRPVLTPDDVETVVELLGRHTKHPSQL